jgi:DNA-binding FrmR family transcriptional regulator
MAVKKSGRKEKTSRKMVDPAIPLEDDLENTEGNTIAALSRRMNRIQGQVIGIGKMIEDRRTCMDILNQISAVKSALDGVAMAILEKQAYQCLQETVDPEESKRSLQEFIDIVRKYAR